MMIVHSCRWNLKMKTFYFHHPTLVRPKFLSAQDLLRFNEIQNAPGDSSWSWCHQKAPKPIIYIYTLTINYYYVKLQNIIFNRTKFNRSKDVSLCHISNLWIWSRHNLGRIENVSDREKSLLRPNIIISL